MCWVKRGFWSSEDVNSCWLDESDLLAVAAVKSKRWNQPSAPTATTKFCQTEQKKKNTLYHQNFPDSLLQIINHFITHPSFVADVSDCDAGQLGKQQIVRWVRETISLWVFSGFCTDHAHTGSCDPGFGVVILVHVQLSTCVPDNQLVQLQLNGEGQQINFYIIWNKCCEFYNLYYWNAVTNFSSSC